MIGNFAAVGYGLVWLFTARKIFGALRAGDVRAFGADEFDGVGAAIYGVMALMCGFFWPLAIPVAAVVYRPAKTPEEVKTERDALQVRIRELEADLQIRGNP